ncbi:MAG: ATP-dependent helicase HrpB [Gammaproteobacteria bacterium]|nr:ATP-dependent helicase HrpB [Gammaproteobacteria bacterium]
MSDPQPIDAVLPELLASLAVQPRVVLEAPPGAGKTTRVPLALLKASWCTGKVLMLEPRRIAARAAAGFMAAQLGEAVGETVGYRIRFERKVSARTRVEIVTEGILTRMLQDDPLLDGVSAVVFDEFHERHLASDLGLAMCLEVQAGVRPELRLVVMSATLDGERLASYMDAPRVTSEGRSFPVDVSYLPLQARETPALQFKRAVRQALLETDGDLLCFLPGKAEIERSARLLDDLEAPVDILHGELGMEEQARVLRPSSTRRIVLATNVAESSVTLPGVRAVIDSGLAREPRFDAASGMSRLETVNIAQSSARQRAGRAGRVAAGRCYRLWSPSTVLDNAARPEIQCVELSSLALEMKVWGSNELRFLDAPPAGALAQAHDLLRALDALDDDGRITAHGNALLALGAHPRLANAMLRAPKGWRGLACDVAALIEGRDPMLGEARRNDDLRVRLAALHAQRSGHGAGSDVHRGALATLAQAARQWRARLKIEEGHDATRDLHALGDVLALAYPDRIAHQDDNNPQRYVMANGRGAQLGAQSSLVGEAWLVIAELRFDARDSLIQRAAPCALAFLEQTYPSHFTRQRKRAFNPATRAVEESEETRFAAIVLERRTRPVARDAETAALLAEGVASLGLDGLPWSDALREWQARVVNLRAWCPELALPDVSDAALLASADSWLTPLFDGKARLSDLGSGDLAHALHQQLDYAQRRALDEHAPEQLTVPSGMQRKLDYAIGEPPVLAVKLQEMFGLAETPRIARGRVPVLLHLLSPRQTPLQVTQDLKGFWERTYPEVKKEMKGRYPKHPWPDDPWTATATHRAKPRGT